ncbi:hypothetical protein [Streptomyces sp. NPDC051554]|uniref:hypothetical protein n=1 Tax=Streptomyces sp. NPDC051554 TaxID=3365656 RepID=UPI0037891D7C
MIGTIAFLLVLAALFGGWLYARMRWRIFVKERQSRRAIIGHANAKAANERARPLTQRIHTHLPDRIVRRILRWHPDRIRIPRRTVRIARRGLVVGRAVRINPAQHIAAVGTTGSGKTSVLRILSAWALQRPDWQVVALDGKWGASAAPYRRHVRVIDDLDGIEAFLIDLVEREFPARGRMTGRPHLALVVDESRVFNSLSPTGLSALTTVMQTGRELGVHVWCGLQDFKVTSVPSEIRMLFTCKIAGLVPTAEDAALIFKELAAAGWRPDRLERAGQVLVWEPHRRQPHVSFALWMSEPALTGAANRVCLVKVPPLPVAVAQARTPLTRENMGATATATPRTDPPARSDAFAEAIERALLGGPAGPRALARTLGRNPGSVARVLARMTERGVIEQTPSGYALTTAPKEQDR